MFSDSDAYSLQFTTNDVSDHVLLKVPHNMTAFSLSLWMKTSSSTKVSIASTDNNGFALEYSPNVFYIIVRMFSSTVR